MLVLAFDTATPAVTAALHDGDRVLAERTSVDGRRHGELLAPYLSELLAEAGAAAADVTDLAVGVGPGPFTSLRVGLVTAVTFAARATSPYMACALSTSSPSTSRPTALRGRDRRPSPRGLLGDVPRRANVGPWT